MNTFSIYIQIAKAMELLTDDGNVVLKLCQNPKDCSV